MGQGLLDLNLEPVVIVNSIKDGHLSPAHERIEDWPGASGGRGGICRRAICTQASAPHRRSLVGNWPYKPGRRYRSSSGGINHIHVVRLKSHVPAPRTNITDDQCGTRRDLALNV